MSDCCIKSTNQFVIDAHSSDTNTTIFTKCTKRSVFLSAVTNYTTVCQKLVAKYEVLKDTVGNGYVSDAVMHLKQDWHSFQVTDINEDGVHDAPPLKRTRCQLRWLHIHTGKMQRAATDEISQVEETKKTPVSVDAGKTSKNTLVSLTTRICLTAR